MRSNRAHQLQLKSVTEPLSINDFKTWPPGSLMRSCNYRFASDTLGLVVANDGLCLVVVWCATRPELVKIYMIASLNADVISRAGGV